MCCSAGKKKICSTESHPFKMKSLTSSWTACCETQFSQFSCGSSILLVTAQSSPRTVWTSLNNWASLTQSLKNCRTTCPRCFSRAAVCFSCRFPAFPLHYLSQGVSETSELRLALCDAETGRTTLGNSFICFHMFSQHSPEMHSFPSILFHPFVHSGTAHTSGSTEQRGF